MKIETNSIKMIEKNGRKKIGKPIFEHLPVFHVHVQLHSNFLFCFFPWYFDLNRKLPQIENFISMQPVVFFSLSHSLVLFYYFSFTLVSHCYFKGCYTRISVCCCCFLNQYESWILWISFCVLHIFTTKNSCLFTNIIATSGYTPMEIPHFEHIKNN